MTTLSTHTHIYIYINSSINHLHFIISEEQVPHVHHLSFRLFFSLSANRKTSKWNNTGVLADLKIVIRNILF